MNIPINEIPFGIYSLNLETDDLGCDFNFVNVDGEPRLVVGYDRSGHDTKLNEILNSGIINPVAGVPASFNPVNRATPANENVDEPGPSLEVFPQKRLDVGNMAINEIGDFNHLMKLKSQGQQLSDLIPSAIDATTSNYIKERSLARVQGDTNLNSGLTEVELREVASAFTSEGTQKSNKRPNSLEKLPPRRVIFNPDRETSQQPSVLPENTTFLANEQINVPSISRYERGEVLQNIRRQNEIETLRRQNAIARIRRAIRRGNGNIPEARSQAPQDEGQDEA